MCCVDVCCEFVSGLRSGVLCDGDVCVSVRFCVFVLCVIRVFVIVFCLFVCDVVCVMFEYDMLSRYVLCLCVFVYCLLLFVCCCVLCCV